MNKIKIINLTENAELSEEANVGQAIYSQNILRIYDVVVNLISNSLIWRCPSKRIIQLYDEQVTDHHLDVGVGTGYFLDKCTFPTNTPQISLMDINETALSVARKRINHYPSAPNYKANVLSPIPLDQRFKSIGINYLLHCLPGDIRSKSIVFQNLRIILDKNGVVFGSTILHDLTQRYPLAKKLADFYNKKNIFTNKQDTLKGLENILKENFESYQLESVGAVGIFIGHN